MTNDDRPAGPEPTSEPVPEPVPEPMSGPLSGPLSGPAPETLPDPLRRAAELVTGGGSDADALEVRLKRDAFASVGRIKPATLDGVDFERDVLAGDFFAGLPAPLQGIAIARTEGALAFYQRVGWHAGFLGAPLEDCVPAEGLAPLRDRYHATDLHSLAYVHPKHFEKMLGKLGAAALWETLKRRSAALRAGA